jgi:hypothetical protein
MTIEVGREKPREIDFTYEGKPLAVRRLSLRLGLKLQEIQDDSLPPETVAEVISECVVGKDGMKLWSVDDVLEFDLEVMLNLFSEVSGISFNIEEAEKN